jgi:hypothetical protein
MNKETETNQEIDLEENTEEVDYEEADSDIQREERMYKSTAEKVTKDLLKIIRPMIMEVKTITLSLSNRMDKFEMDTAKRTSGPSISPLYAIDNDLDLKQFDNVSSRGRTLPARHSDNKGAPAEDSYKRENKDRRKTMMGTIADQYTSPKAEIKVTRQQPPYDHIILKKLTIKHVVKFISSVGEYQARNGVSLPLATMLDKDVRSYLIARSNDMFQGSDEAFFSLPAPEVLELIRKAVKPHLLAFLEPILPN